MSQRILSRLRHWWVAPIQGLSPSPGEKHLPYLTVLGALEEPGEYCPFCRAAAQAVARRWSFALYESVNDAGFRAAFRRCQGLCAVHGALLRGPGDRLGGAVLYLDLLEQLDLQATVNRARHGTQTCLVPPCIACQWSRETEALLCRSLVRWWDDASIQAAMAGSPGLCLAHLLQAAAGMDQERKVAGILDLGRACLERLRVDLGESVRRHDYRYGDQPAAPDHGPALDRAIAFLGTRPPGEPARPAGRWHRWCDWLVRSGPTPGPRDTTNP